MLGYASSTLMVFYDLVISVNGMESLIFLNDWFVVA